MIPRNLTFDVFAKRKTKTAKIPIINFGLVLTLIAKAFQNRHLLVLEHNSFSDIKVLPMKANGASLISTRPPRAVGVPAPRLWNHNELDPVVFLQENLANGRNIMQIVIVLR